MSLSIDIATLLRERGQRPTPQRLMILSVLAEHEGHMTAEEVFEQVRREYPALNLSTVYRTLEAFRDNAIVSETDLGGGVRQFEMLGRPHHHLICLSCNQVAEMDESLLAPLRDDLRARYGFAARLDHLAIFGLCRACGERAELEQN